MLAVDQHQLRQDQPHQQRAAQPQPALPTTRADHPAQHAEHAPDDGEAGLRQSGADQRRIPRHTAPVMHAVQGTAGDQRPTRHTQRTYAPMLQQCRRGCRPGPARKQGQDHQLRQLGGIEQRQPGQRCSAHRIQQCEQPAEPQYREHATQQRVACRIEAGSLRPRQPWPTQQPQRRHQQPRRRQQGATPAIGQQERIGQPGRAQRDDQRPQQPPDELRRHRASALLRAQAPQRTRARHRKHTPCQRAPMREWLGVRCALPQRQWRRQRQTGHHRPYQRPSRTAPMHFGRQPYTECDQAQQQIRLAAQIGKTQDLVHAAQRPPAQSPQICQQRTPPMSCIAQEPGAGPAGQRQQYGTHAGCVGHRDRIVAPGIHTERDTHRRKHLQRDTADLRDPPLLAKPQPQQTDAFQRKHARSGTCGQRQRYGQGCEPDRQHRVRLAQQARGCAAQQPTAQARVQRGHRHRAQRQWQPIALEQARL